MSQMHIMNKVFEGYPDIHEASPTRHIHEASPTRRRRSQPSLDAHPYHPRASAANGMSSSMSMSGAHMPAIYSTAVDFRAFPANGMPTPPLLSPTSFTQWKQPVSVMAPGDAPTPAPNIIYPPQIMAQLQAMTYGGPMPAALSHDSQLPTSDEFEVLLNDYVMSLSEKKRDKALIGKSRYNNIYAVLREPKCTTIESAQFRFWAKKMFTLGWVANDEPSGGMHVVMHDSKPVAIREHMFDILTTSHVQCQHGGRDKTSAQVRKFYSWVPKELIARFVRNCPSCMARRSPQAAAVARRVTPPRRSPPLSPATNSNRMDASTPPKANVTPPLSPITFKTEHSPVSSPMSCGILQTIDVAVGSSPPRMQHHHHHQHQQQLQQLQQHQHASAANHLHHHHHHHHQQLGVPQVYHYGVPINSQNQQPQQHYTHW